MKKRFISLLIALALCTGFSITAAADSSKTIVVGDGVSVILKGIVKESNETIDFGDGSEWQVTVHWLNPSNNSISVEGINGFSWACYGIGENGKFSFLAGMIGMPLSEALTDADDIDGLGNGRWFGWYGPLSGDSEDYLCIGLYGGTDSAPTLSTDAISYEENKDATMGIKLNWDAVEDASYYHIYRSENGGENILIAEKVNGTSYVDLDIKPDSTYTYVVKPYFEGTGEGGSDICTNESSATTGSGEAPLLPDANGIFGTAKSYILMQIDNPKMDVNGTLVEVDPGRGTAPILRYDRTMLPVRSVTEAMNGSAQWDADTQKATLNANSATVEMWIGVMDFSANGEMKSMDIAPFIENNRTMLPLRFVAENLNCRVQWINDTREILIVFNGEAKV